uniref:NADH-ubiquinone oxidoreductase chain 4 n=1 Tax=Thyreus decorus TaxID=600203 RepID=A0A7U0R6R2_9HYME|nr:NADH dehydrogenase subunit 4 [Thyreus decorus]QQX27981.1 NADH dehydrogenase subunit 4 [Thyreus decorus]
MELILTLMLVFFIKIFNIHLNLLMLMINLITLFLLSKLSMLDWWDINYYFGMNSCNYGLIILSMIILSIIIINLKNNFNIIMVITLMFMIMMMNFYSMNLLLYYFFYESSLIFIFYLIMNWSYSIFKLFASYMMMFYTLLFSLPMLLMIFYMNIYFDSLMFLLLELNYMYMSNFMIIYMMLGFLVKVPMFFFHGWLLKAHVEAPFYGSMILASIMLKLGSYGILRLLFMFKKYEFKYILIMINILGILIMSLMCLQQIDMKLLIAISSVVHMGLMLSSMFMLTKFSILGSFFMMLSHGFCSSGLFYLVNEIYKNSKTRLIMLNKGMLMLMPSMSLMWFLMCSSNSAIPLTLNLFSEIFLMCNLLVYWKMMIYFLILYCFFSFMYSIYLFSMINHGLHDFFMYFNMNGNLMSFFTLMFHWIPINLVFLFMMGF